MNNRIAIQGMPGSYTEMAVFSMYPDIEPMQIDYMETFDEVFDAVDLGRAKRGGVAFSNTRLDSIQAERLLSHTHMHDFWIESGTAESVQHCVAALPGTKLIDITEIHTQPEAFRQCGAFVRSFNGGVDFKERKDTALSAKYIQEMQLANAAAICSEAAAKLYKLEVIEHAIQDDEVNLTRFVGFTKYENRRLIHEDPNFTIAALTLQQRVGSLSDALLVLKEQGINMRYIRSRNIPNTPFEVDIVTEIDTGMNDPKLREAIGLLAVTGARMTIIGSYREASSGLSHEPANVSIIPLNVEEELAAFDELLNGLIRS